MSQHLITPSTLSIHPASSQQTKTEDSQVSNNRKSIYLVKVHFGQALTEEIPEFIIKSMKFLLKHCYNVEGLFRISGNAADISKLKKQLNDGKAIELKSIENVHNIAGLVKMYFRELPNPVMTFECYDMFVIADSIPDEYSRFDCIKKLLAYIPPSNRLVLQQLCLFLHELSKHSSTNRMNSENLSIVFSPNILRAPDTGKEDPLVMSHPFLEDQSPLNHQQLLQTYKAGQSVVKSLIDHVDYFFSSDCLSYIEYLDSTLNTTTVCSSPSATTKISEEIYGSSVEEVTSSIKTLSEKITRLCE